MYHPLAEQRESGVSIQFETVNLVTARGMSRAHSARDMGIDLQYEGVWSIDSGGMPHAAI